MIDAICAAGILRQRRVAFFEGEEMMKGKWLTIGILTVCFIIFTIMFSFVGFNDESRNFSKVSEIIKFISLSISSYGVLFSVLITSFNNIEATKNNSDLVKYNKINNSFSYMNRFDSPSIKEARDITRKMKKDRDKISNDELIRKIEGPFEDAKDIETQENLKRSVITMFNFFEEIYLSIKNNHSDETILRTVYSEMYIDIYERFSCWLEKDNHMGKLQLENLKDLKILWEKNYSIEKRN